MISLYSLEKLIEWKLALSAKLDVSDCALYSLEKLIEWKLGTFKRLRSKTIMPSTR
ncbi:Similarity (modular protein) [Microcystis aeruginosa PCC 7941]|nr:Similarity (modular protein) [Microcystis aeruginosa PCC 7941]